MTDAYNPAEIEPRWQKKWEADGLYRAVIDKSRPKFYMLTMFPYPSGDLHMGHWYAMAPADAYARWLRMQGYNVLFPMGFDAFGLPAENAARKRGIHPATWTWDNIKRMRKQLRSMGASFDWEREVVTCDPEYYRWTEWFFLKFYEKGLAYKKLAPVDFCPTCNTTLAREQVLEDKDNGKRVCERCKTPVIKKNLEQWFFRITEYAEELLDHSQIEWPERVKLMQKNWIGRSEGAEVIFKTEQGDELPVFTTRPDTLWGATFMVLAPEHPLVEKLTTPEHKAEVEEYVMGVAQRPDYEREAAEHEKTGVFTGSYAINPVNGERIPIWIADYVLVTYGSGAIMAVPAHDERDFEFAKKYNLPIPVVIAPPGWNGEELEEAYTGPGRMVNSGPFNGTVSLAKYKPEEWTPELAAEYDLPVEIAPEDEARNKVTRWLEEKGIGKFAVSYRLRDWLISRQRYWGAPIPIVYCDKCGIVPVPEEDLPVLLPEDAVIPETGENALLFHEGFLNTTCPKCGGPARRETDTMDTFMCSSWYQYRYLSPHYDKGPFDPEEAAYWLPVDQYTGGVEHATMHLLYTRFFTKAMRDCGMFDGIEPVDPERQPPSMFSEPMTRLFNQGIILGEDGEKMSKSRGNVVAPDDIVGKYGADSVRAYLMFAFKWDQGGPWDSKGIMGVVRWLNDVWTLVLEPAPESDGEASEEDIAALRRKVHQTIKRVTDGLASFSFNTAIASLMELRNTMSAAKKTPVAHTQAWDEAVETMLLLMAPFVPHIAEELWVRTGHEYSIHQQSWPVYDEQIAAEETITLVIQVNGKVRDRIQVPADISEDEAKSLALQSPAVQKRLNGGEPRRVLYVPGKLVNVVV